jgi:hypothetical protein
MITPPSRTRIWLAGGVTDMRKGFDGLAMLVRISPPQLGQVQLGSCMIARRGRCAGKARRCDFGRFEGEVCSAPVAGLPCAVASATGAGVSASSSSRRRSEQFVTRGGILTHLHQV